MHGTHDIAHDMSTDSLSLRRCPQLLIEWPQRCAPSFAE